MGGAYARGQATRASWDAAIPGISAVTAWAQKHGPAQRVFWGQLTRSSSFLRLKMYKVKQKFYFSLIPQELRKKDPR